MSKEPRYRRYGWKFWYDPLQYENNPVTSELVTALETFLEDKKETGQADKVEVELGYIDEYKSTMYPTPGLTMKIREIQYRWQHQYGQFQF